MSWFRVDDDFAQHYKQELLEEAAGSWQIYALALALWTLSGADSAARRTDGGVSAARIARLFPHAPAGARSRACEALCIAKLWEKREDGIQFHDWESYQPTKAEMDLEREHAATRQRNRRKSQRDIGATPPVTTPVTPSEVLPASRVPRGRDARVPRPVPSRPDPDQKPEGGARERAAGAPPPLPFSIGSMLKTLGDASGGKLIVDPFDKALAAPLTAIIRSLAESGCSLDDVAAAGRWIGSGGLSWMAPNDPPGLRWIAKPGNLSEAIGKARARPNGQTKRVPTADELEAERTGKTVGSNPFANWTKP